MLNALFNRTRTLRLLIEKSLLDLRWEDDPANWKQIGEDIVLLRACLARCSSQRFSGRPTVGYCRRIDRIIDDIVSAELFTTDALSPFFYFGSRRVAERFCHRLGYFFRKVEIHDGAKSVQWYQYEYTPFYVRSRHVNYTHPLTRNRDTVAAPRIMGVREDAVVIPPPCDSRGLSIMEFLCNDNPELIRFARQNG
jgi:hypothetical protein